MVDEDFVPEEHAVQVFVFVVDLSPLQVLLIVFRILLQNPPENDSVVEPDEEDEEEATVLFAVRLLLAVEQFDLTRLSSTFSLVSQFCPTCPGANSNPTFETLRRSFRIANCTIDFASIQSDRDSMRCHQAQDRRKVRLGSVGCSSIPNCREEWNVEESLEEVDLFGCSITRDASFARDSTSRGSKSTLHLNIVVNRGENRCGGRETYSVRCHLLLEIHPDLHRRVSSPRQLSDSHHRRLGKRSSLETYRGVGAWTHWHACWNLIFHVYHHRRHRLDHVHRSLRNALLQLRLGQCFSVQCPTVRMFQPIEFWDQDRVDHDFRVLGRKRQNRVFRFDRVFWFTRDVNFSLFRQDQRVLISTSNGFHSAGQWNFRRTDEWRCDRSSQLPTFVRSEEK